MGRIILTIAGPWSKAPDLKTDFQTEFSSADPEFAEDFIFVGRRADGLEESDFAAIRAHTGILRAGVEFSDSARAWAEKGVRLALDAVAAGACGVFIETACKALTPHASKGLSPREIHNLFHFYVELLGDGQQFSTEGMQAFDLPEVIAIYAPDDRETAQAAAFSMAARMVCDGFKPADGGVFRASESAPLYDVARGKEPSETAEDLYANPYAPWILRFSV